MTSAPTRSRTLAFAGLALGGIGGLVLAAQPWFRGAGSTAAVRFTGPESTAGLAQALPLVVLAGTLLALALRAVGRRLVGALALVAGLGAAVTGVLRPSPSPELVSERMATVTLGDAFALDGTAAPWAYALAGLVAAAGGLVLLLRAGRWPSRAARFERDDRAGTSADADPAAIWSALDAGRDPTDPTDPGVDSEPPPIRAGRADGVTMKAGPLASPVPIDDQPDVQPGDDQGDDRADGVPRGSER